MTTFKEANQVRSSLKIRLSYFHWYSGSAVFCGPEDYYVLITVKKIDNEVKKNISPFINGVVIKLELEKN